MLTMVNKRRNVMISKATEEYLKTMYVLKKQNGNIRVTDIANKMSCTKPSVNKALKSLKENGYIEYETYGPIKIDNRLYFPGLSIISFLDVSFHPV